MTELNNGIVIGFVAALVLAYVAIFMPRGPVHRFWVLYIMHDEEGSATVHLIDILALSEKEVALAVSMTMMHQDHRWKEFGERSYRLVGFFRPSLRIVSSIPRDGLTVDLVKKLAAYIDMSAGHKILGGPVLVK